MKISNTASRLQEIMDTRKIKQVDILALCKPFCEKYGVRLGRNDLSQYVNGKVEPGSEKLTILGLALGVNEAWLMGYDVSPERKKFSIEEKSSEYNSAKWVSDRGSKIICRIDSETYRLLCNAAEHDDISLEEEVDKILHDALTSMID